MNALIFDLETCPTELEGYLELPEADRLKLLNPIQSEICAAGVRYNGEDRVWIRPLTERQILEGFWAYIRKTRENVPYPMMVGFNVKQFDLHFLAARSFVRGVPIVPLNIKDDVIDLREVLSALRYGSTRGKLKEYAKLIGCDTLDMNGEHVAELCIQNDYAKIEEYLRKDLQITETIYERCKETRLLEMERW